MMTGQEDEITFRSEEVSLAGTLLSVPGSRGIVVFVHGSGPQDRNENVGRQRLDVFNTLAQALAEAGFSSLRYDKRGCGASGGDFKRHRVADLVTDLRAAIRTAQDAGLGPVYLCGHSEGTLLAPMAAQGAEVAGMVLLCPFVTDMQQLLVWQAEGGDRLLQQLPGTKGRIARVLAGVFGGAVIQQKRLIARVLATEAPYVRMMGRKIWVNWLRDLIRMDPAAVHAANDLPTLLVVAEKDVQCPPEDGPRIMTLCASAELDVIPNLTHLLRLNPGMDGLANYPRELAQPMAPIVGQTICDWLLRRPAD